MKDIGRALGPRPWRNFTTEQTAEITRTIPPLGAAASSGTCPACASPSLHWYSYRNDLRPGSRIAYVWCSACRHYHGDVVVDSHPTLTDPYDGCSLEARAAMESDLGSFFAGLDALWAAGHLPQLARTVPRKG
jgi:hypothetical protein